MLAARVLLVDDEQEVLDLALRTFTASRGWQPVLARSGREAEALIEERAPDLVISDIEMPEVSGLDLARRIRATHPGVPVILLSGRDYEEKARAAGASVFMQKPLSPMVLVATARALLTKT